MRGCRSHAKESAAGLVEDGGPLGTAAGEFVRRSAFVMKAMAM